MEKKDINILQQSLIQWYRQNHRRLPWRETDNPFYIWVSEVMLQQTQVKTVLPYYQKFLHRFPDLKSLSNADLQDVLKIWEGLGYYARARNLHRAAKMVVDQFGGEVPDKWEDFRKLPGVGEYIASAVLSIAFQCTYAVVDGNVRRVLSRLFLINVPVNKTSSFKKFKDVAAEILDPRHPEIFNQAMMELGAIVCRLLNPACNTCPLQTYCRAYQMQKVNVYPRRISTKKIPEYHIATGVVYKNGRVLITQRKPEGLLGGLWEFPGGKIRKKESAEQTCVREVKEEVNLNVEILSFIIRVKHAYTHFKIIMDVFQCNYVSGRVKLKGPVDFRWITLNDIDSYPFPKSNHKFIPYLQP
ncbi:A/G-specific adenine glycosylase [Thermodesulfobacteriota bacterium]